MPFHRRFAGTLAWVALLAVGGAVAHAQLNRIADIKIVGNKQILTEVIRERLAIKIGDPFAEEDVAADAAAIREMGYFKSVDYEITRRHDGVVVTFTVQENNVVENVTVTGNTVLPLEALMKQIELKPHRVLHTPTVNQDVNRIESFYRANGYLANVVDVTLQKGVFTYKIREVVIDDIQIEGLKKTRPYVVLREMKSKPGQVFNANLLRRDLNKIYNLNIFKDVTYERRPAAEPGRVLIVLKVKEQKTGVAAIGVGFSSRSELVGFADLDEKNFRGQGQHASLRVEFGDRQSWATSFYEPWVNDNHMSANVELFNRLIYREPTGLLGGTTSDSVFEERRKGGRIAVGQPLSDTVSVSVQLKNEEVDFRNTANAAAVLPAWARLGGDISGHVSSITLGIAHDTRDIIIDPTTGGRESFDVEWANTLFGGENVFEKWEIDLRRYHSLSKKVVLAGRFQTGFTSGDLPAYEQYFLGGAETLRGFDVDRAYGKNMMLFNFEYRYRLQKNFQAVGFVDYGDAYGGPYANRTNFDGLLGYGVGIRVKTPLGPIRLDLGFSEDGSHTHFSIGQMF